MATPDIESQLLTLLSSLSIIEDSRPIAKQFNISHEELTAVIKSLESSQYISTTIIKRDGYEVTAEAAEYISKGAMPEVQVFNTIPVEGCPQSVLSQFVGDTVAKVGVSQCMQLKWITLDKSVGLLKRNCDTVTDTLLPALQSIQLSPTADIAPEIISTLSKRKMLKKISLSSFSIKKDIYFSITREKPESDITTDMLAKGTWKTSTFKSYNLNALGSDMRKGCLHPLLKVRAEFRQIFLELGYEEMPTNRWVESSFWNFDSLFQPQQHPARDAHDTFFLTQPSATLSLPSDYLQRVLTIHQTGGHESKGYGYEFSIDETKKNILRTHTTAISSQMLYKLSQDIKNNNNQFIPKRYFSIDRVFRNERLDRTHLAEFHQVEGLICDLNLYVGHLIATIKQFFERIGMTNLRFKPAFNPYTEPSMEIFGYHPGLGRWVELGNSGVFRPEMLLPMGLPPQASVIAWGLSVERPTMIKYGISNIRDLFGHQVDVEMVRSNPVCRLSK